MSRFSIWYFEPRQIGFLDQDILVWFSKLLDLYVYDTSNLDIVFVPFGFRRKLINIQANVVIEP